MRMEGIPNPPPSLHPEGVRSLELQAAVSCLMGVIGTKPGSSGGAICALNLTAIYFSSPQTSMFSCMFVNVPQYSCSENKKRASEGNWDLLLSCAFKKSKWDGPE